MEIFQLMVFVIPVFSVLKQWGWNFSFLPHKGYFVYKNNADAKGLKQYKKNNCK